MKVGGIKKLDTYYAALIDSGCSNGEREWDWVCNLLYRLLTELECHNTARVLDSLTTHHGLFIIK